MAGLRPLHQHQRARPADFCWSEGGPARTLADDSRGLALGTARGVVKRVNPEILGKDSWEVIRLEAGDRVVGAVELTAAAAELVFVTNDAQLLHFPATAVRPQGRSGGGMAGIKLGIGASVVY